MGYPKTLYKIVNSLDEEKQALADGCFFEDKNPLPYPKMLYLHPVDNTKQHKFITVNSPEEHEAALKNGYRNEPHVPVSSEPEAFEETEYEAGSGSERWGSGAWTDTVGAGITDDTSYLPTQEQANSVKAE